MLRKIIHFIQDDIWRIRADRLSKHEAFWLRPLRIFLISLREFINDQCMLRASALTYFSLLSIVPVFAMAFGFAKGFGVDKILKAHLLENMSGQEEVVNRIIDFSEAMLNNTKGGLIAGIGIALLFWTVIKVLGHIENSFNHIWGVKKQRSLGRKFSDYLSLMLICPVFVILASSATVFIASQVELVTHKLAIFDLFGPVILMGLKLLPFCVFWGLLTFVYMFMPNTRIHFMSAFLGGVVAGTVYQIVQRTYIYFQIGVAKAGAIYGSFAALPLFLVWLQMSWLIVLYGAELAFAHQNEQTFEFEPDCLKVSHNFKKTILLRITHLCVQRFCREEAPLSASEMSNALEIPIRLMRTILYELTAAGILVCLQGDDQKDLKYQPATDVSHLTVKNVVDRFESHGIDRIPFAQTPEMEKIRETLAGFDAAVAKLSANVALKEL